jgi:hypothetical protein
VSVDDAFELAQVRGAHFPLFGFALSEDAQSASIRRRVIPGSGLCGPERIF